MVASIKERQTRRTAQMSNKLLDFFFFLSYFQLIFIFQNKLFLKELKGI